MLDQSGLLRTELSGDDLHPNAQGYAIMAPLADAAIKQALKWTHVNSQLPTTPHLIAGVDAARGTTRRRDETTALLL